MLPLIPALLMLILNGPATAEQPSRSAQWNAVFRACASAQRSDAHIQIPQELIANSSNAQFTHALFSLLIQSLDREESVAQTVAIREPFAPIAQPSGDRTPPGFEDCRRSRDGPATR